MFRISKCVALSYAMLCGVSICPSIRLSHAGTDSKIITVLTTQYSLTSIIGTFLTNRQTTRQTDRQASTDSTEDRRNCDEKEPNVTQCIHLCGTLCPFISRTAIWILQPSCAILSLISFLSTDFVLSAFGVWSHKHAI